VRTAQEPIRRNRLAWDALRPDLLRYRRKERFGFCGSRIGNVSATNPGTMRRRLKALISLQEIPQTGAKWDARRLLSVGGRSTLWPRRSGQLVARHDLPTGDEAAEVPHGGRADGAGGWCFIRVTGRLQRLACVVLAIIGVFSIYLTPVSAKNATALTPPGTGGIKASASLLRSELRFANGGATARRHLKRQKMRSLQASLRKRHVYMTIWGSS